MLLHSDHDERARMHCDNYTNKLTTEAVQLLNGALYANGRGDLAFYADCHDHPWRTWAGESLQNWQWLYSHAVALGSEFCARYDNDGHGSIEKMKSNWTPGVIGEIYNVLPDYGRTQFPICTDDFEPSSDDPIEAYREYMIEVKADEDWFGFEKGRSPPDWL
jgi:hypothetical protein